MRIPIFLVILLFLALPSVIAIGVSPPSARLDFVPGKVYDFNVILTNYNDFPIGVNVRAEGLLSQNIRVKQPINIPGQASVVVPVSVTMPQALDRPGLDTSYLYFAESFDEDFGGSFAARTEVGMQLIVWEPYPGNYAEITASAPSVGQGNDTKLTVNIINLGTEPVDKGTATVRVLSPDDELKDVFTFTMIDVPGNSNAELYDRIPSHSYVPGRYTLDARLQYADNVSNSTSSFIIGKQDVDVTALEGPVYLDKPINRVNIHIESLWNLPLDNVNAQFELGSSNTHTASISLQPFQKGVLTAYWETDKTVPEGSVPAKVTLFYPGGQKDVLLPIQVYNVTPQPATVPSMEEPTLVLSAADLIFIALAVLIVIAIIVFAFERHLKPSRPQQ